MLFSVPTVPRHPASARGSATRHHRRGFALLITVTLLAFLVLLLVSLATLTRVETRVASNSQQLSQARQNALFSLNLALGRLQQLAGPDQRVTAAAEVLSSTHATKRKWTGVWNTTTPTASPSWLVSGATPDASAAATTVPAAGYTASDVRLVGPATTDTTTTPDNGNEVVVPLQNITGNGIPGVADTPSGTLIGRYGYWVGDEGVKARANLGDAHRPPWFTATPGNLAPDAADQLDSASLAQRSALELVSLDSGSTNLLKSYLDFDPADSAAHLASVGHWLTREQLPLLDTAAATVLSAAERARFHDLTLWSAGVQANVVQGGLKRDLTAAFEQTDAAFQASDLADAAAAGNRLQMAGAGNAAKFVSPIFNHPVDGGLFYHGPTWHLLRNHYRLYTKFAAPFTSPTIPAQLLGPTIISNLQAYTSFYNGTAIPDPKVNTAIASYPYFPAPIVPPLPTRPALVPYLSRLTFVFSLQTVATGQMTADTPAVPIYEVRVVVTPYIVLHNPYNVSLQLKSFHGLINGGRKNWGRVRIEYFPFSQLVYGYSKTSVGGAAAPYLFTSRPGATGRDRVLSLSAAAYTYDTTLKPYDLLGLFLPEMTLAPGEVRTFSPNSNTAPKVKPIGYKLNLDGNAYYEGGYYFDCLNGYKDFLQTGYSAVSPVKCPTGPDWTLVDQPSGDYHLRVPGNMPIKLMLTGTSNASATATTAMSVRLHMDSNDNVTINGDSSAQAEIIINPVGMGSSAKDIKDRTYSGYGSAYDFETPTAEKRADEYASDVPTPVCAYDIVVKPADQPANAARPFVTSNPLAPVTARSAAGSWSSTNTGYPLAGSAWQPQYRRLSGTGNAWSQGSIFAVDPDGSGRAYWGPSNTDAGLQNVSLIDVPTRPLASLAQFQHLMISLYGHDPYFAIGNSCATPYTGPSTLVTNAKLGAQDWWLADISYLANQALWDGAFFSTLAPGFDSTAGAYYTGASATSPLSRESIRDAWLAGVRTLPNSRVIPYLSPQRDDATRKTQLLDCPKAAANLLVEGSFNINSRSVEAWTAVLAGARKAPMTKTGGATVPVGDDTAVPRTVPSVGDARGTPANNWNGFAQLADTRIRALAAALVARIAARQTLDGRPFLSLAEFVNRRVASPADATLNAKGVLQAAIDDAGLNGSIAGTDVTAAMQADFPYPSQGVGSSASAASGFLLQADVLQQIGPFLSARSDTFTIRSYGESINPVTGVTDGRAWCEAVVQRVPDYVNPADDPSTAPASASASSQAFGRRFQLVSFRWLSPNDI